MVENKQSRVRLAAATSSPSTSPGPGRASSSSELKSSEEWNAMHPSKFTRISVLDLKAQIVKRIGPERANSYFSHFRSFISSCLSKQELDKLVLLTIGRENVPLHNQLVKAILSNAVQAQFPPPPPTQDVLKPLKVVRRKPPSDEAPAQGSPSCLSNGDSVLSSPRRGRSYIFRDRVDRPSPLGPREENSTPDLYRPIQQQPEAESSGVHIPPSKRLRISHPTSADSASAAESGTSGIEENAFSKENWREETLQPADHFIRAPLGIPYFSSCAGTARRPALQAFSASLLLQEVPEEEITDAALLPDKEITHRRMEEIAAAEGLEGVGRDCVEILNHAVDSYLGRLIKACIDVTGPRQGSDVGRPCFDGGNSKTSNVPGLKFSRGMNGVWAGFAACDDSRKDQEKTKSAITLTDFKVAMEMNPQQLGEGWPVQLEKISFRIFDQ